jgi:rod shape-determining protein MreD
VDRLSGIIGVRVLVNLIPVSAGVLAVFLANVPISLFGGALPAPLLALMPVYYWCLVRPDLMSPAWAFVIGVLQDILSGGPPGIWAGSFVATYALIDRQRDAFAGLSGLGAVLGFATAALVACSTAYLIVSFYYWRLPSLAPVMVEFALTVLYYAPAAMLLGLLHHHLVGPLRSEF